ncbi:uncharacterized protein TNIN_328441 [Trichonephila inaurata madagascariensis]|uniref:Uncharacterized protein n=1 Tax=Trichonephila inaurata madagascariensis TaxID=2747483 RepID=A0A8X6YB71_9ARAC|nr:uncharacterized protein TNIN_328441 [Trichonephila inaurata madagascariensis]
MMNGTLPSKYYQWPEYVDPTLADGSGWNTCYPSSPSMCTDNPGGLPCVPRYFPKARPMRRRRLFPPPFNHFTRGMRPQWSTPYYDCGFKWNSQPPAALCSSPSYCYEYDPQVVEPSSEKPPPSTNTKKSKKNRGSSQLSKSFQTSQNGDQSICANNGSDWSEKGDQNECFIPSDELSVGYQTSGIMMAGIAPKSHMPGNGNAFSNFCHLPVQCHKESSSSSPVCSNKIRARESGQNDTLLMFKPNDQELYSNCGKEDKLNTIVRATIFEGSVPEAFGHPAGETSQGVYFVEEQGNPYQEPPGGRDYSSPQNILFIKDSYESTYIQDPETSSQNPDSVSCQTNSSYNNVVPLTSEEENALAVFNLQLSNSVPSSIDENISLSSRNTSEVNQMLNFEKINSDETTLNKSLVVYDALSVSNEQSSLISEEIAGTSVTDRQCPSGNDSHPYSSTNDESVSSLIQQNQLLTDLLSQLISGGIESQKNLFADIQAQEGQKDPDCSKQIKNVETTEINCTSAESFSNLRECDSSSHQMKKDLSTKLQSSGSEDWISSCVSTSLDPLKLSSNENSKSFNLEQTSRISESLSNFTVEETTARDSLMLYGTSHFSSNEIYPSNIDLPSSDNESNHIEATLSSVTNYVLEEPVDKLANALISVFDDAGLAEVLSSCVKPNSVLKVKRPRKSYKRVIKVQTKRRIKRKSSNIKNQQSKKSEKRNHEFKSCEDCVEKKPIILPKVFCHVQTQVEEQDMPTETTKREACDAETQCGDITEHREKHETLGNVKKETILEDIHAHSIQFTTDERDDKHEIQTCPTSVLRMDDPERKFLSYFDTLRVELTDIGEMLDSESGKKRPPLWFPCLPEVNFEDHLPSKLKALNEMSRPVAKRRQQSDKATAGTSSKTQMTDFLPRSVHRKSVMATDRTLRTRKVFDYSEPRLKRMRISSKPESECDSTEVFRDTEGKGRKNSKDSERRISTRSRRITRDRRDVTPCQHKKSENTRPRKRRRTETN